MSSVVEIAETLARALSSTAGWRFTIKSSDSVKVGIDDGVLGGAYSPPSTASEISGAVFIVWDDGSCSLGRIDSATQHRLEQDMELWRKMSYRDDDAAHIARLAPPADVTLYDPRVQEVAAGQYGAAFDAVSSIARAARAGGADLVDAQARCYAGETIVASSNGLWVKYPDTMALCRWELDKTFSDLRAGRTIEAWQAAGPSVERTAGLVVAARNRASVGSGRMRAVLSPDVADDFVEHYLASNLSGEAVAEGRSRYSPDQFRAGERVFREDISVILDTSVPLAVGSYPCTPEGIPAGRVSIVKGGSLVTPMLNLKYSKRCGMAPTPMMGAGPGAGHAGLTVSTDKMETWETMACGGGCGLEDGILVCSVLGMHTQDPASGDFSLAVPEAIVVRGGEMRGAVKAVISGNFFEALSSSDTVFGRDDEHPNPGMALTCHVEVG